MTLEDFFAAAYNATARARLADRRPAGLLLGPDASGLVGLCWAQADGAAHFMAEADRLAPNVRARDCLLGLPFGLTKAEGVTVVTKPGPSYG